MKDKGNEGGNKVVRMELKYCERCGSLWLRECGAGVVYCGNCQLEVADLPVPKKKPQRVKIPVRGHTVVEEFDGGHDYRGSDLGDYVSEAIDPDNMDQNSMDRNDTDLEAAGGAA